MKNTTFSLFCLLCGVIGGSNFASAYDVHHPDPMAILNGQNHSHTAHATQIAPPPPDDLQDQRFKRKHGSMYVRGKESKYIPKPEPYSLASKKQDPELLGPQRTYRAGDVSGTPADTNRTAHVATAVPAMTEAACVSLLGKAKFDQYVEKYGGQKGALRRCLILKRTHG